MSRVKRLVKGLLTPIFGEESRVTGWFNNQVVTVDNMYNFEAELYDKIKSTFDQMMGIGYGGGCIVNGLNATSSTNTINYTGGYVRLPNQNNINISAPQNALIVYSGGSSVSVQSNTQGSLVARFTNFTGNNSDINKCTLFNVNFVLTITGSVIRTTDVVICNYKCSSTGVVTVSYDNSAFRFSDELIGSSQFGGLFDFSGNVAPTTKPTNGLTYISIKSGVFPWTDFSTSTPTTYNVTATAGHLVTYLLNTTTGLSTWVVSPTSIYPDIYDNGAGEVVITGNLTATNVVANNIHFAGDTKLSFQAANHASGNGMWMIANGQSIPTQYTRAIAIFGAKLPNITDAVIGVAGGSHLSGTSYGANAVAVPVSSHYHGMTLYNGHTHSMNAYNAHTHADDHKHNDNGHNHQYITKTGTLPQSGSTSQCWIGDAYTQTNTGYASINYKSQVAGQSVSTSVVDNAGTNVTDAVKNANSRTDDAGTAGVTMSVLQPTYYTKNLFIFCC